MEARMSKYGVQASPERERPRPAPKQVSRKIPVVYYLCRNHHLEHPHFIEVTVSSHEGLYLRGRCDSNGSKNKTKALVKKEKERGEEVVNPGKQEQDQSSSEEREGEGRGGGESRVECRG
ncbi:uncharacterized protein A4U43_C05F18070 [Asparagus officinalis]|uniref:SOSEKI DIX-like domain-containing protein n=1 Tax=Asparagus officinalis TaxID=4686 RepID=A0A5P1ET59_ASPOF|nr:uncharacterized protein A4U43_C05F18070 [Asparagus officinalis]